LLPDNIGSVREFRHKNWEWESCITNQDEWDFLADYFGKIVVKVF